jgi:hypothetical protein
MLLMLTLAAGIPRAGSGWHYNLIHDLVVAGGGQDARAIRRRFGLAPFLTEVNLNIRVLSPQRLWSVIFPTLFGKSFAIKTHSTPTTTAMRFLKSGRMEVSYIYRDPRAALLSALEYGERARKAGSTNAFSVLENFEDGLTFMQQYLGIWEAWMAVPDIHILRYEDFLGDYEGEAEKLAGFLGADAEDKAVAAVIAKHHPDNKGKARKGQHFQHGEAERFRKVFSEDEMERANQAFAGYLERMGYSV